MHTGTGDPLLKGPGWNAVRRYWIAQKPCCVKCGTPLNTTRGHRGPDALDVGHIVGRDEAKAMGWTRAQINALTNTQPECRRCNRRDGARYVNAKRQPKPLPPLIHTEEW